MKVEVPQLVPKELEVMRRGHIYKFLCVPQYFSQVMEKINGINASPLCRELGIRVRSIRRQEERNAAGVSEIEVQFQIEFPLSQMDEALSVVFGEIKNHVVSTYKAPFHFSQQEERSFPKPTEEELKNAANRGFTVGLSLYSWEEHAYVLENLEVWNSSEMRKKYGGLREIQATNSLFYPQQNRGEIQLTFLGRFSVALVYYFIRDEVRKYIRVEHTPFYPVRKIEENAPPIFIESPDTIQPDQPSR